MKSVNLNAYLIELLSDGLARQNIQEAVKKQLSEDLAVESDINREKALFAGHIYTEVIPLPLITKM